MQYVINRSPYASEHRVLTANALKIIAAIAMVLDHVAIHLIDADMFTLHLVFRLIGRLAFPIFAYFIAEGCRYTRHKLRRFLIILGGGVLFEAVYLVFNIINAGGKRLLDTFAGDPIGMLRFFRSYFIEGNIFLTLACSILLIHILQDFKKQLAEKKWGLAVAMSGAFLVACGLIYGFNYLMNGLSYGIYGIMLPVLLSFTDYEEGRAPRFFSKLDHPMIKLAFFALGLIVMTMNSNMKVVQTFGLLSLIPLALYNGKPGSAKLKWWFYIFYPAHLVVIWLIGLLIK
jgi:hypothetical protein